MCTGGREDIEVAVAVAAAVSVAARKWREGGVRRIAAEAESAERILFFFLRHLLGCKVFLHPMFSSCTPTELRILFYP